MSKFDIIKEAARKAGYSASQIAQWKWMGHVPFRHRKPILDSAKGLGEELLYCDMGEE